MAIIKLLIEKIKNNHMEIDRISPENKHNVIINFITLYSCVPWFLQVQFGWQVFLTSAHQAFDCHYRRVHHTQ